MTVWNDDAEALLRKLWSEGCSAREIAERLHGATRNSIIGKAHRLGLESRASVQRVPRRPKQKAVEGAPRAPRTMRFRTLPQHPVIVHLHPQRDEDGAVANVLTLKETMCRFPIGDPASPDFAFCGRDARCGPYCETHARLAYQRAR